MADQLVLLQEAASRGILPDNLKPLYAEAVSRGLIPGASTNPAVTKQAGYQATGTNQFTPIANAGQQAQAPQGSGVLGAGEGAANTIIRGVATPVAGIAGFLAPSGKEQDNMDAVNDFVGKHLTLNSEDANTRAGSEAVQGAVGKVVGAPAQALNALYTLKQNAVQKMLAANPGLAKANPDLMNPAKQAQSEAGGRLAMDLIGNTAPLLIGPRATNAVAKAPAAIPDAVSQARNAGYAIPPSEAAIQGAKAPLGKALEGLTGSAKLRTDAAIKAQKVTDGLAAQEIGVAPGTPLTDAVLSAARQPHNAVYKQVSGLSDGYGRIPADPAYQGALSKLAQENSSSFGGNPDIQALVDKYNRPDFTSAEAVEAIKSLRKNATSNYKASNAFQVKNAYELGDLADAQQTVANALENQIQRFAEKIPGQADLVQRWKDARQSLAKIASVDNAIKEGTTNVSAPMLAKQLNKGLPLSGNLRTIAETANNFPRVLADPSKLGNKVPFNMWESGIGVGGGAAYLLHEPHIAALAGAGMVARPLARATLLSKAYQDALLNKSAPPLNPHLAALLPMLGVQSLATGNENGH